MSTSRPPIDLRSDTVTRPTPAMLRAMVEAPVGDDVFGDDPTVGRLEARTAELLGKEAAVYVPSGTMANQIGVGVHTRPGDELVCSATSHVYLWEAGGIARHSGSDGADLRGGLRNPLRDGDRRRRLELALFTIHHRILNEAAAATAATNQPQAGAGVTS